MRYSPYDMKDYGLQHQGGVVTPITLEPYSDAEWNLHWAATPELDGYLELPYGDFEAFRALTKSFPFRQKVQTDAVLKSLPTLREVLASGTPRDAAVLLQVFSGNTRDVLGLAADNWLETVLQRLAVAQSLVDVKDAAAFCQSIIAVDFRAGRRV